MAEERMMKVYQQMLRATKNCKTVIDELGGSKEPVLNYGPVSEGGFCLGPECATKTVNSTTTKTATTKSAPMSFEAVISKGNKILHEEEGKKACMTFQVVPINTPCGSNEVALYTDKEGCPTTSGGAPSKKTKTKTNPKTKKKTAPKRSNK